MTAVATTLTPSTFDGIAVSSDSTLDDGYYRARTKEGWTKVRSLLRNKFPRHTVHVCLSPKDYGALMRAVLPDEVSSRKQRDLLVYIRDYSRETGFPPSFGEMADALNLVSKSGVHRLVKALEERGFIKRLPNRARSIDVIRQPESLGGMISTLPYRHEPAPSGMVHVDYLGGVWRETNRVLLAIQNTPAEVTSDMAPNPRNYFVVEVRGDYLVDAGIQDRDRLLLKREDSIENGSLGLFVVDDDFAVLRRVRRRGASVALESDIFENTRIYHTDRLRVMGRVTALLRTYRRREEAAATG